MLIEYIHKYLTPYYHMKKATFIGALSVTSLLLLSACSDDSLHSGRGVGTIFPLVELDPTVVKSASSRADGDSEGSVSVEDLTFSLVSADGSVEEEYQYSDFPTDQGFPVGDYTLTVSYGSEEDEGFDAEAYLGTCDFTVAEDQVSQPSVVATPSKAMLYIHFDDMLLGYMKSIDARILGAGGTYIDYLENETRPAYILPGETAISVDFVKQNGKTGKLEVASFNAEAQHCYTMTLTLAGDGYGKLNGLTVKYDDMLELEDVEIDISDEVLSKPAPEVTAVGFTPGEAVSMVEGTVSAKLQPRFSVKSISGLTKAILTTHNCPSLIEKGWPVEVDLCNPSAEAQNILSELGLRAAGFTGNTDKFAAVDLTHVLPNITPRSDDEPASEFTLAVTDIYGKTCDPVTFAVKVELLELEMTCAQTYAGEGTIDLNVHYNGPNLKDNLRLEYLNVRGLWVTASYKVVSQNEDDYVITVTVPSSAKNPLTLRGTVGSVSVEFEVPTMSYALTCNANDVFATKAYVTVTSDVANPAEHAIEMYGSTDGGSTYKKLEATQTGAELLITGLTPDANYILRASVDGWNSKTLKISTEAADQIPGSDMENWIAQKASNVGLSWNYHDPDEPWVGNNSIAFSKTSAVAQKSAASCVDLAGKVHSGSFSGMVRTVGYGASTAIGKSSHFVAGEMTLGDGIEFASRPSSLSFWAIYSAYNNGDEGLAEVSVLDVNGNEIASGSITVPPVSDYTKKSIPLTYTRGAGKAAKIKVRFRSSATDNYLNVNGVANNSGGCTGSYMYIDDVELAY